MKYIIHRKNIISVIAGLVLWTSFCGFSEAATLSLVSSKNTLKVGETATVRVVMNTQSVFINNGEAVITVPAGLSVESINRQSSVFNLWVEEPAYSVNDKTVSFNGGVANPGYQGTSGGIVSFVVRAKQAGTYALSITGASLRENDGLGTDVLKGASGTTLVVQALQEEPKKEVVPDVPVVEPVTVEKKNGIVPIISSPSHPDQSLWYQTADAVLSWTPPQKLVAIKTLFDAIPRSIPQGKNESPSTTRTIKNIKDGVGYFHLRYVTALGVSETAHFAIHIDTVAPDQVSAEVVRNEKNERVIVMSAQDALSGVDSFDVAFNDEVQAHILASNGKATYAIPRGLEVGTYAITITAYDKARNKKSVAIQLNLDEYEPPVLAVHQKVVYRGMNMILEGRYAVPNKELFVYVKNPNGLLERYLVKADNNGALRVTIPTWKYAGTYEMWTESLTAPGTSFGTVPRLTYVVRGNFWIPLGIVMIGLLPIIFIVNSVMFYFLFKRTAKKVIKKKREIVPSQ